jgi:type II secretory pathway predicted ATPase ExeA
MLSEVKAYFGLTRAFRRAGYFETEHHRKLVQEIKSAVEEGQLIALAGMVGCGKTTTLHRIQQALRDDGHFLVSRALAVDKDRINLGTLMLALFYDLATEKDFTVPTQPEKRERKLLALMRKCHQPVALFVDEAHDLPGKTLVDLKRLIELVQDGGGTLSVVLVGHPKLKHELRRPALEEIGSRATVFTLEGIQGQQRAYLEWLLDQCTAPETPREELLSQAALEVLADRLVTPLQMELYLTLAFEEAYQIGQKPVTPDIIETVLSKHINDLEPRLIRHGYRAKVLAELLNVRQAEIRAFLHGQLPPARTQELRGELLALGIPLQ